MGISHEHTTPLDWPIIILTSQDGKIFQNSLSDSVRIAETGPHINILDLSGKHEKYREEMKRITEEFSDKGEKMK